MKFDAITPFVLYFRENDKPKIEKRERSIMKINRNMNITFKLDFYSENVCKELQTNIKQIFKWKIFDINKTIRSYTSKYNNH